jgi:trk system potassium uptake protein TrkA
MKQFVIIGLGAFGKRVLEELSQINVEVMVIDQDEALIEQYSNRVSKSFIANALHEEVIRKLVPQGIDGVVIDLGGKVEVSALVTNYLNKMGVKNIVARAESDEHGEILSLLGASRVVFPTREAKRITPLLVSPDFYNFLPISDGLVIAEIQIPPDLDGKTLIEVDFRKTYQLNIMAVRDIPGKPFHFVDGDFRMTNNTVLLAVGDQRDIIRFSGFTPSGSPDKKDTIWKSLFFQPKKKLFSRFRF